MLVILHVSGFAADFRPGYEENGGTCEAEFDGGGDHVGTDCNCECL